MRQYDPRLRKGIVVITPYGIATVHDMMQTNGEARVVLEFWRDITQGDRTFANSVWPLDKCEFMAENDQKAILSLIGEDYE